MGFLSNLTVTVEIAPGDDPLAATFTWVAVTSDVLFPLISDRGRQSVHQTFDAGWLSVVLNNASGDYDPSNASGTHYPNLRKGTPIRITATYATVTYPVFLGHITRLARFYSPGGLALVDLEAVENIGLLTRDRVLDRAYAEESTDDRIDAALDDGGWPSGARDLAAGVASCAALTYSGTVRDIINQAVEAEQGRLFTGRDGDIIFLNRANYSSATAAAIFGPVNLDYWGDVTPTDDDDLLINRAEVTGSDENTQVSTDATSIAEHGQSGVSIENPSILGAASALNVAEWLTGSYATVDTRIPSIQVAPDKDPTNLYPQVLGRELGDVIQVIFSPPAGDDLDLLVSIERVRHELANGIWLTTYGVSPLSALTLTEFWILGTSDDLDTDTILA